MEARLLAQPFGDDSQLGRLLTSDLADHAFDHLRIAVAWAKRSGLARITHSVEAFRGRGGSAEAIIGLDEGGATWEGLELAQQLFQTVHLFHDAASRTFHPKLYILDGLRNAALYVGSSNLTRGGLYTNYEASVRIALDKQNPSDRELYTSSIQYFEMLRDLPRASVRLDDRVLSQLRDTTEVQITSEAASRERSSDATSEIGLRIFGSVSGLSTAPPLNTLTQQSALSPGTPAPTAPITSGIVGFFKALSAWDASPTSAPGQIIIPRRFSDFFGPLTVQIDNRASGGVRQSETVFPLEPADYHPRPNIELRFTFRDRDVFDRLAENDILVFNRNNSGITVERHPPGAMGSDRFGFLPAPQE